MGSSTMQAMKQIIETVLVRRRPCLSRVSGPVRNRVSTVNFLSDTQTCNMRLRSQAIVTRTTDTSTVQSFPFSATPIRSLHFYMTRSLPCSFITDQNSRCRFRAQCPALGSLYLPMRIQHMTTVAVKGNRQPKVPLAKSAPLKRSARKKVPAEEDEDATDHQTVGAYAVGADLDLYRLKPIIEAGGVYDVVDLPHDIVDVLMVEAKYKVNGKPREVFFFSDGGVTCWNMPESERAEVVKMARVFTARPHKLEQIMEESETLPVINDRVTCLKKNVIHLRTLEDYSVYDEDLTLEKYAFSNALAQSVNLSISEGNLEKFIEDLEPETQRLGDGMPLLLNKKHVNMKLGEVFLLRHEINLETGFLDTPDIYWEREELENLYREMVSYLMVPKRTRVINERLNYCSEILGLFNNQLNDKHHVRLEWIIIILILIEVMFEILHHVEKYRYSTPTPPTDT